MELARASMGVHARVALSRRASTSRARPIPARATRPRAEADDGGDRDGKSRDPVAPTEERALWCADEGDADASIPSSARWHRLQTRWEADEETAMEGDLLDLLSPAWRILLLSDGSVTRHLRLLCPRLTRTRLECTRQGPVGTFESAGGAAAVPEDVALIQGELVQREVLLRVGEDGDGDGDGDADGVSSTPMVYAASWWSRETFDRYMTDSAEPMWNNLRSQNVELYREVRRVYMGDRPELEAVFGKPGPYWGRHYIFWHKGAPMTVVYEVFNPALERQLGPAKPPAR